MIRHAHVIVVLLNDIPDNLKKIVEHQRIERPKKVYETQLKKGQRFNWPPPPVPPTLAATCPELVEAYARTADRQRSARQSNPLEKVRWHLYKFSITTIKAYLLIS